MKFVKVADVPVNEQSEMSAVIISHQVRGATHAGEEEAPKPQS